jgi:membrane protease YdiL (CAAX protease family)
MTPQKRITIFLALTFGLSTLSYIPILTSGTLAKMSGLFVFTLMWTPGVAALITQWIATHSLRGLGWRPGPARWLWVAYILPVLYALPVYAFVWLTGLGGFPNPVLIDMLGEQLPNIHPTMRIVAFLLISSTIFVPVSLVTALGEEIGWRGLLVPELVKITGFSRAALISGAVWAVWHMPAVFFADYNSGGAPAWYSAACFAVMVLGMSFAYAWLRLKSGSLWSAALLHASHNLFVQEVFDALTTNTGPTRYFTGEFGIGLALASLVVVYVFWRYRHAFPEADALVPVLYRAQGEVKK